MTREIKKEKIRILPKPIKTIFGERITHNHIIGGNEHGCNLKECLSPKTNKNFTKEELERDARVVRDTFTEEEKNPMQTQTIEENKDDKLRERLNPFLHALYEEYHDHKTCGYEFGCIIESITLWEKLEALLNKEVERVIGEDEHFYISQMHRMQEIGIRNQLRAEQRAKLSKRGK